MKPKLFNDPRLTATSTAPRHSQAIFRFKNNLGASVICHPGSYGYQAGLFELLPLEFGPGPSPFDFDFLTDYPPGYLTDAEVREILDEIEQERVPGND